jgi:hypothetical protein
VEIVGTLYLLLYLQKSGCRKSSTEQTRILTYVRKVVQISQKRSGSFARVNYFSVR